MNATESTTQNAPVTSEALEAARQRLTNTQNAIARVQNLKHMYHAFEFFEDVLTRVQSAQSVEAAAELRVAQLAVEERQWQQKIDAARAVVSNDEARVKADMDKAQAEYARFVADLNSYRAQLQSEVDALAEKRDALAAAVKGLHETLKQTAASAAE